MQVEQGSLLLPREGICDNQDAGGGQMETGTWGVSLGVSLYHQARDARAQINMLSFLLVMKPFCSQESKIALERKCRTSLVFATWYLGHCWEMPLWIFCSCCIWLLTANIINNMIDFGKGSETVYAGRCQGLLTGLRILLLGLECLSSQKVFQVLSLVLCLYSKGLRCTCFLGILSLIGKN